ncbi:hypothetical protein GL50803_0022136 [Giardia duodenalis]|uniref:Uncharacterized protein n=1 Tax=Giardia intestinalis (strain ATCC 50803 / WB clone C6) TaxID=184922 RepID=A8BYR3_GIAIC|nr:hypothetical protein GL50803_0022136 [Giardia intestinalis]KAE8302669.1 hypothetical protein GL50803_0022136 [Giardia intestinalis]|eukprot:XP_001704122.1 Hypothetical protein GL50803_22136 [Giardia lamblia ATCC 50803]
MTDTESQESIDIKLYTYDNNDVIVLRVKLDDTIGILLVHAADHIPEGARVRVVYNGRTLQLSATFQESNVLDGSALHLVAAVIDESAASQEAGSRQPRIGVYRGGLEKHLQAGVERQDVIGLRLIFLARAGFLTSEHLQILYTNTDLIEQPRGYTQPSISRIRLFLINALQASASAPADASDHASESVNETPNGATRGEANLPLDVRHLYVEQEEPDRNGYYPPEFISNSSFALMMLEGGFPPHIARQFLGITDLSWIDETIPFPTMPLRVIQCENLWMENESPTATITTVATVNNLLGPGTPVQPPTNRVMSDFHKFMLLIFGLLVGLIFNVLVLVYVYHSGVPAPMRMGIVFGLIGSIIFSLFINIASGF